MQVTLTPRTVSLSKKQTDESKRGIPVPTKDFILASRHCALERAYLLEFVDQEEEDETAAVLSVYFNASQASRAKAGPRVGWVAERAVYKKRKSQALVEDGEEED